MAIIIDPAVGLYVWWCLLP